MTPPVVVVGDVAVDVLARPAMPPRPGTDAEAEIRMVSGGGGANTAGWLARLGVPVTLVGRVGDDMAGRQVADALTRDGVRCALAVDRSAPTGSVVVVVAADGERTMLSDRGANLRLSIVDIPQLPARGHLHVSGYTLLHGGPRQAGLTALGRARRAGMTVSVDPASTGPLADVGADAFLDWTRGTDLLLPNLPEARLLSGCDDALDAARVLAAQYGAVAVTLGADGALWAAGDDVVHQPAPPVTAVVDSTGAGDAFCAGLLAAWLGGVPGPEAVRRGMTLAAKVLGRLGAQP
jgi:ribokinase